MQNKIRLENLHKSFNGKIILDGVNLNVPKGQSTVIIGGSGTGKSVLLKCILGLIAPDSGEIFIDDTPKSQLNNEDFLENFGMLFQGAALFDSLKIWENVAFRRLQGHEKLSKSQARERAIEKLKRVGLAPETADLYPSELSGGMQKRAGLARAIASNPDILFFDEPTTGLDPIMSRVINELIQEIVEELGATALTITHDMNSVRAIAHNVVLLYKGKIHWSGKVSEMDQAENTELREFISGGQYQPQAQ